MKNLIVALIMGMGIICSIARADAKDFKEHQSKEFTLAGNASRTYLYIYNISGFIKVEGYAGSKVLIEMDKTISANDDKQLELGKKEFKLGFSQQQDTVMAYIAEPFDSRPRKNWQHNDDRRDIDYHYKVDFTVKVPYGMNLHISTVNEGEITVDNVSGLLDINNVNGAITVKNAKGTTRAHTVNGNVTVDYLNNPGEASSYYTINGTIRVSYQPGLSADCTFKSMNGEFFTDFTDTQQLPATVTKEESKKGKGAVYKINKTTTVRFGKGGKTFSFETLNGNVYIKKQS
ncbi:MAG: hypothetical protein ACM3O8_05420 [Methylococcaceae bacterium]